MPSRPWINHGDKVMYCHNTEFYIYSGPIYSSSTSLRQWMNCYVPLQSCIIAVSIIKVQCSILTFCPFCHQTTPQCLCILLRWHQSAPICQESDSLCETWEKTILITPCCVDPSQCFHMSSYWFVTSQWPLMLLEYESWNHSAPLYNKKCFTVSSQYNTGPSQFSIFKFQYTTGSSQCSIIISEYSIATITMYNWFFTIPYYFTTVIHCYFTLHLFYIISLPCYTANSIVTSLYSIVIA